MTNSSKRMLALLLAVVITVAMFPVTASAATVSGGDAYSGSYQSYCTATDYYGQVNWNFDKDTGTLTISGTGSTNKAYDGSYEQPWNVFRNAIQTVTIKEGITNIGALEFKGYSNLTSVTIPDSVTRIGYRAFQSCTKLKDVILGNGVTLIEEYAFYNCDSLTSISIPDSVTSVGYNAFYSCDRLQYNVYNNAKYLGNSKNPYMVLVKASSTSITSCDIYNDAKIICDSAFYNCSKLTSITIPDSVTTIGYSAFRSCDSLTSVTIGDGVTTIGDYAFYSCENLASVTIGDGVTTIGYSAFYYCRKLTNITVPEGVTTIGDYAFYYCRKLTNITIPDSITYIGDSAFYRCNNLEYNNDNNVRYLGNNNNPYVLLVYATGTDFTTYEIPDGTKVIYDSAFRSCYDLTSITIPDSVTTIGDGAFSGCESLKSITIPDGVTAISSGAFRYCVSLTSITIPDSVTTIGEDAFYCCYQLKDVYITDPSAWCTIAFDSSYGNPMYYADSVHILDADGKEVTRVILDNTVTEIPRGAFSNCDSLESITIPDSVTRIAYYAFSGCDGLTNIDIPKSVTSIDLDVFSDCNNLLSFSVDKNNPNYASEGGALFNKDKTVLLTVPGATVDYIVPQGVTTINSYAFSSNYVDDYDRTGWRSVSIPTSVTTIKDLPPSYYSGIKIYYTGTESQWKSIEGVYGNENVEYNHTHDYSLFPAKPVAATCTAYGYTERTCAYGETFRQVTAAALGHDYSGTVTVVPSTCEAQGYTQTQCIRCDAVNKTDYVDSLGHKMVAMAAKKATCTEDGNTAGVACERCKKAGANFALLPATGHSDENVDGICDSCNVEIKSDIALNEQKQIQGSYDITYLLFVPQRSGNYTFTSISNRDTKGYIFDAKKAQLYYNDNSGDDNNFSITCHLTAGKIYYLGARLWDGSGSFNVKITYEGNSCKHANWEFFDQQEPTCTKVGYTAGVYCTDCKEWAAGHRKIVAKGHSYAKATCTKAKTCINCNATEGKAAGHKYTNDCDTACDTCGAKRTIKHNYQTKTTKATTKANGKIVKSCKVCANVASTTTIYQIKSVTLSTTKYTYSGKKKTPSVTVKDSKGKTLKKDTDYTVSYASGRTNVGTYTVAVTFKGNYSGSQALSFTIVPKAPSINKLTGKSKSIEVKLNKQTTQTSGYEIEYSTSKSFKSSKKTTISSNKTTKKTIKSLKKKTKYYVRVRAYKTVSGKKIYSSWSGYKSVKTK